MTERKLCLRELQGKQCPQGRSKFDQRMKVKEFSREQSRIGDFDDDRSRVPGWRCLRLQKCWENIYQIKRYTELYG